MNIEINMPDIGADIVEIAEILVKEGDKVEIEQSLIIIESDKASIEVPSPRDGIVKEIKVSVGDKIQTGQLIMIFDSSESNSTPASESEQMDRKEIVSTTSDINESEDKSVFSEDVHVHATPLIRRLAREFDIDLTKVIGTGHKGRILREDIQSYIEAVDTYTKPLQVNKTYTSAPSDFTSLSKFDFGKFGEIEEVELTHIQKISGKNLSRSWTMIPHVTHFDKADITELEIFRKRQNVEVRKHNLDTQITLVSFIMKAVASALEQMPRFNSSLSKDGQSLILKKYINIGVAVDTPKGLVVPVFKDVKRKGIIVLSQELVNMKKKARDGKLKSEEIQGGCFTISSIGRLGTTHFVPIINSPEVSILGVSKSSIEPIWDGTKFSARLILPLSLSFDHRVIDGADGARFIAIIKNILSDIRHLIMQ